MIDKLLIFPGKTDKGIFTFVIDAEQQYLEKTAAQYNPVIASYIHNAKPIPGKTQILLTALGAGEFWGCNVNGDYFTESGLANPSDLYGHKTFERYAKAYKHHINKDPSKGYGDVALAVYNPIYHRVELIVVIDNARAPDIAEQMENGDYPEWSMGCLRPNALVLMADSVFRPISEIGKGAKVVNANGGISVVDYAHNHKHTGTWVSVSALGLNNLEDTTEEHPWLVVPSSEVSCAGNPKNKQRRINNCFPNRAHKKGCQECPNGTENYRKIWKRADELSVGDYVATPVFRPEVQNPGPGKARERLLGLYMAQGHITSDGYLILSVHVEHKHLFDQLKEFFPDVSIKWSPKKDSLAASIDIYDKKLASWCVEMVGKYAHLKHISKEVMCWNKESQRNFLGGYHDGDGGVYKNSVYFSTCNEPLSRQVSAIALRLGCIASTNIIHHKPSTIVKKETTEYQVWIGQDSAHSLNGFSSKGANLQKPNLFKNQRFIWDNKLWSPITSIGYEECEEDVYNIAIKSENYDTDSYTVNGVALHNCKVPYDVCSICGNKAPTRKQYCDHARYMLGQIDPETGKQVYVINERPRFHDISKVLIGADRIAKTLMKVASATATTSAGIHLIGSAALAEKMAERTKTAVIAKKIPTDAPPASEESLDQIAKNIPEVKASEKSLPTEVLDRLSASPISSSMSTMASLGILPKPHEFQRIFLRQLGKPQLADTLHKHRMCFDPSMTSEPEEKHERALGLRHENFDSRIMEILRPFMADRSYSAPHLARRMIIMVKTAEKLEEDLPTFIKSAEDISRVDWEKMNAPDLDKERKPMGLLPMLMAAAGLYAAFGKKAPDEAVKGIDSLIQKNPGLAAALGVGLASTFGAMMGPNRKGKFSQGSYVNPDAANGQGYVQRHSEKPLAKTGGMAELGRRTSASFKRLFVGIPAVYLASGILQKHKELNPYSGQQGGAKNFIRKNPDLVSGALIADALLASRGKGTYGVARKLTPKLKSLMGSLNTKFGPHPISKTAATTDFLGEIAKGVAFPLAVGGSNLPGRMVGGLFDQAVLNLAQRMSDKKKTNLS